MQGSVQRTTYNIRPAPGLSPQGRGNAVRCTLYAVLKHANLAWKILSVGCELGWRGG